MKIVVIDKATDSKSRVQLFTHKGNFMRRVNLGEFPSSEAFSFFLFSRERVIAASIVPKGGIEVWAATATNAGHLVMVDQASAIYTLDISEVS